MQSVKQDLISSPHAEGEGLTQEKSAVRTDRTIVNTLRGAGVKWLRHVYSYRVADMASTLRKAFTTAEPISGPN